MKKKASQARRKTDEPSPCLGVSLPVFRGDILTTGWRQGDGSSVLSLGQGDGSSVLLQDRGTVPIRATGSLSYVGTSSRVHVKTDWYLSATTVSSVVCASIL